MQHIINLIVDDNCEMAEITLDGKYIMSGNFWDFYSGCTPSTDKYGDFKGYNGLIKAICNTLGETAKIQLIRQKHNYDLY